LHVIGGSFYDTAIPRLILRQWRLCVPQVAHLRSPGHYMHEDDGTWSESESMTALGVKANHGTIKNKKSSRLNTLSYLHPPSDSTKIEGSIKLSGMAECVAKKRQQIR
jgi:hypothetical protein